MSSTGNSLITLVTLFVLTPGSSNIRVNLHGQTEIKSNRPLWKKHDVSIYFRGKRPLYNCADYENKLSPPTPHLYYNWSPLYYS